MSMLAPRLRLDPAVSAALQGGEQDRLNAVPENSPCLGLFYLQERSPLKETQEKVTVASFASSQE